MKKSDLSKMIREAVREEVRTYLPILLPLVVNEVVEMRLNESAPTPKPKLLKTKEHRTPIRESVKDEEWPTLGKKPFTTNSLKDLLGYGDLNRGSVSTTADKTTPTIPFAIHAITEHGTAIPVNPDEVPDHVVNALTRDYSSLMKAMEKKKNG